MTRTGEPDRFFGVLECTWWHGAFRLHLQKLCNLEWKYVMIYVRRTSWTPPRAVCAFGLLFISAVGARAAETGRLFIKSTPGGAEIFLDDEEEPRGKTPCIMRDVPTGTHVLRGHLEGYVDVSQEIEVRADSLGRALLTFTTRADGEGEPGSKEPGPTTVTVGTERKPGPADGSANVPDKETAETADDTSGSDKPERYIYVDCLVCGGTGLLQEMGCPGCEGTGLEGFRRCTECDGTLKVEHNCPYCWGTRIITRGGKDKDCPKCKGKGKLACPLCRGKGKYKRSNPEFSAKPTTTCPYCQGSGFESDVRCLRCAGKGTFMSSDGQRQLFRGRLVTYHTKVNCPFCGGDGKGPPLCPRCRGSGVLDPKKNPVMCPSCFGTGKKFLPCKYCRGKGRIRSR